MLLADHWFAVRRINHHWWDLNSTLDKPNYISNFYLSALLSQYREEGCTVFLVVGFLDDCGAKNDSIRAGGTARWYNENEILPVSQRRPVAGTVVTASSSFAGPGHRLGGASEPVSAGLSLRDVIEIVDTEMDAEEDENLKMALMLSMNEHKISVGGKSEKEIMREKRLKMLQK